MKKPDFKQGWACFAHWKGWKAMTQTCVKAWQATVGWTGWRVFFGLPLPLVLLLSIACGGGLVWVFVAGLETKLPLIAYIPCPPIP